MPLSIEELLKPQPSPAAAKIKEFLDADKSGELYTKEELAAASGLSVRHIMYQCPALKPYSVLHRNKRYLAKPSVIAAFYKAATKVPQ